MKITLNVKEEQHLGIYLKIWSGALNMTKKESDIVRYFIVKYDCYVKDGVKEEYAKEMTYSQESFDDMRKELKLSPQNWNNFKQSLKKKKILLDGGKGLIINPKLHLSDDLQFTFKIKE